MYFYRLNEHDEAEFFYVSPATNWYISVDGDDNSTEIILICNGQSYLLLDGRELINEYPGLKPCHLYDFFNEVIHGAFLSVQSGAQCIDLTDLQEKVLPKYIAEWMEMGLIQD